MPERAIIIIQAKGQPGLDNATHLVESYIFTGYEVQASLSQYLKRNNALGSMDSKSQKTGWMMSKLMKELSACAGMTRIVKRFCAGMTTLRMVYV